VPDKRRYPDPICEHANQGNSTHDVPVVLHGSAPQLIALGARPKLAGQLRTVSPEDTIRRAWPIARAYGLTRLTDVTGLDRIGIPTYTAVLPDSDDILSVYNGKGSRRVEAMAGALMETIERHAALHARPELVWFPIRGAPPEAILPKSIYMQLAEDYDEDRPCAWVRGTDLMCGGEALVPAGFAGYLWPEVEDRSPFWSSSSQGLAAGNCLEEAIVQAICEWIERDAWTLAELRSHWLPRARIEMATGGDPGNEFVDDLEAYPSLDLDGVGEPVEGLLCKFRRAGFQPVVRDITSDVGVPVVTASIFEDEVPGFPQAHSGVGCHLDMRAAISRALTEAAQSRAVDIQAVREDIAPPEGDGHAQGTVIHTRRVARIDLRRWLLAPSKARRHWSESSSQATDDVREDLEVLLERLRRVGISRLAVVDLSPPGTDVAVVRVAAPGLEAWAADHGRFGDRAAAFWRSQGAGRG
jgi:ribosomal protein S12 methylthiotransferase accessory factor